METAEDSTEKIPLRFFSIKPRRWELGVDVDETLSPSLLENRTHWFEDKAGLCLELGGRRDEVSASPYAIDPCRRFKAFC